MIVRDLWSRTKPLQGHSHALLYSPTWLDLLFVYIFILNITLHLLVVYETDPTTLYEYYIFINEFFRIFNVYCICFNIQVPLPTALPTLVEEVEGYS